MLSEQTLYMFVNLNNNFCFIETEFAVVLSSRLYKLTKEMQKSVFQMM